MSVRGGLLSHNRAMSANYSTSLSRPLRLLSSLPRDTPLLILYAGVTFLMGWLCYRSGIQGTRFQDQDLHTGSWEVSSGTSPYKEARGAGLGREKVAKLDGAVPNPISSSGAGTCFRVVPP